MKYHLIALTLGGAITVVLDGCKVEKTQEGKIQLPKYEVQKTQQGGVQLLKYLVETPKVEVQKKERTVTVPTVKKEERTINIPNGVQVKPAGSGQGKDKQ